MDYIRIKLTNFKKPEVDPIEFQCITYEVEKSLYKFYITSKEIKYLPTYDFVLDIIYPWEVDYPKKPETPQV